jgi:hypothetical protein
MDWIFAGRNISVTHAALSSSGVAVALDNLGLVSDKEKTKENPIYKELFVSASGSDSASGEKGSPFKTLERAKEEIAKINSGMNGDIIVNVASGTYNLEATMVFDETHSGKNGYDVIMLGEDKNNPPVISGGEKVMGWEKYSDVLYRAPAPEGITEVRNLYINKFPAVRARSKYTYNIRSVYDDPITTEYIRDGFTISSENFIKNFTNIEDMEMVFQCVWTAPRYPITKIERDGNMIILRSNNGILEKKQTISFLTPKVGSSFYLENAFQLLDEPGEFYFNKSDGYIYYYPYKQDDLSLAETYVAKLSNLVKVSGENPRNKIYNITFDNLDFRYGAWDDISYRGLVGRQADEYDTDDATKLMIPQQLTINNADNVNVLNCRFSCLGSGGVSMIDGVSNSSIIGNVIKDVSGSGIVIGTWLYEGWVKDPTLDLEMCKNIRVENNVIRRAASEYRGCVGIAVLLCGTRYNDAILNGTYRVDIHHSHDNGITFKELNGEKQTYYGKHNKAIIGNKRSEFCL